MSSPSEGPCRGPCLRDCGWPPRTLVVATAVVGGIVLLVVAWHLLQGVAGTPMRLLTDAQGNEAMVVCATIDRRPWLFLVDTAYAGAPVLSTSYLGARPRGTRLSTRHYRQALRATPATDASRAAVVERFLQRSSCRAFTAGCTMRLMGIGRTSEVHADMLLCPTLALPGDGSGVQGDVLVTNPLPKNVHILTMDFLLHRAPCMLLPRAGRIRFAVPAWEAADFSFVTPTNVAGAFRIPMTVGGIELAIVLDTGAPAPLALGPMAARRMRTCTDSGTRALQRGINGEEVCSNVLQAAVRVAEFDLGQVQVFANTTEVDGADGYAGIGLLRAFDLWLAPDTIGIRRSGLSVRACPSISSGTCGSIPPCAM